MSVATSFTTGKELLRKGTVALAAAASIVAATPAYAGPPVKPPAASFTEQECKVVALVGIDVVKAVGVNTLSKDFRNSFARFIAPDGKTATCTGPTNILTPTVNDVAAFNTIRTIMASGKRPLDLQARGLRSVASANVSSLN